jgi:hypothetical protein
VPSEEVAAVRPRTVARLATRPPGRNDRPSTEEWGSWESRPQTAPICFRADASSALVPSAKVTGPPPDCAAEAWPSGMPSRTGRSGRLSAAHSAGYSGESSALGSLHGAGFPFGADDPPNTPIPHMPATAQTVRSTVAST